MNRFLVSLALAVSALTAQVWAGFGSGPYAGAVGTPTTDAVVSGSPEIVNWATNFSEVFYGAGVDLVWREPQRALGPAMDAGVLDPFSIVSLGRGGSLVLTFSTPIRDGPGPDFAVYENSFSDYFLELAFVEVSSDGVLWQRFPAISLTQNPVGAFGLVDATLLYQLAGKYRAGYGTPFDLANLEPIAGIDYQAITHVRIVDVIGDGRTYDSLGHPIYDPYPTTGSAGFDLDAVAVLNEAVPVVAVPSLQAELVGDSILRLKLAGASGLNYVIEGSTNLVQWTAVEALDLPATVEGDPVRATAEVAFQIDEPGSFRWYRARLVGPSSP
jgi:hypothetical protein